MNQSIAGVVTLLANISAWIAANVGIDVPFNQVWGWNQPSLTKVDLIKRIGETVARLEAAGSDDLTPAQRFEADQTPARLNYFISNVLINLPSGNAIHVVPALYDELERLDRAFPSPAVQVPYPDWEQMAASGYLPRRVATRLRGFETRMDRLAPEIDDLEEKMAIIRDAYQSAEQLPETQASLASALKETATFRTQAQSLASDAASHEREAGTAVDEIKKLAVAGNEKYAELEDAYRAAATKGLASSFQVKAKSLESSVRLWVGALAADLIAGAIIGYFRFEELQKVLASPQPTAVIWGNLVFSVISIAAPVWLGWVATKQINQRFKLAEDYGFKASVASAYEAWKSEAKKQDKEFEQRLFGAALSRLEEAPLRFVETENYGSPWHELTSSPAFASALNKVPELKETVAKIIAGAGGAAAGAAAILSTMMPKAENKGVAPKPGEIEG